ncbi:MAG TPA: flagellar hook capping FlgD N-terminal domain-containing protein [Hyphomicrobiales bacterium]|nr:flagellar hook capping FlgD N-terminal domain-containing protein [Hyphomicrobiales bacterium]
MTVSSANPGVTAPTTTILPASSSSSDPSNQLAGNFNTFLTLLTTQLQNQDPLSPLDTNQFTQQLVEFSSVEQQIQTNQTLSSLLTVNDANQQASAAAFIGRGITADGSSTNLVSGGKATWQITAPAAAPNTNVVITDSSGNQVYSQQISLSSGVQNFQWDGVETSGQSAPAGMYTMTLDARAADGSSVAATTNVQGTVDGVVFDPTNGPILTMGTLKVPLSSLEQVVAA